MSDQPTVNYAVHYTGKDLARELSELFPITEEGGALFIKTLSGLIMRELWSGKYAQLWEFGILHLERREATPGCHRNKTKPRPARLLARLWVNDEYRENVVMSATPATTQARGKYKDIERGVTVFPKSDDWLTFPQKPGEMVGQVPDDGSARWDGDEKYRILYNTFRKRRTDARKK